jgi:glycine/D-amino acid oxidase-like deaminating enzyme
MAYEAIVIGGGIVGMSAAYHLASAGARTLLIDREDQGRATDAGAGILAPETNSRDPAAWFDFAIAAVGYYPALIERLRAEQAGETGYAVCGQLIVAVSDDEVEPFAEARRHVFERQRRRGQPAPEDLHEVSPENARALFPPLAPTLGELYFRNAARVDGRLLAQALRRAAVTHGLSVRRGGVERLAIEGGVVVGVVADGESLRAGTVVIAGGAWSRGFGAQLGVQIPVEPQRGQIIHLGLPGVDTGGWPIAMGFRGHYLLAWPDSRVVVGATRESGASFETQPTAAGVHEVLGEALRVAPGLAGAELREVRVGLRPRTPDGLPVLGTAPGVRGVYLATGHGPTGLQLGPYSGKLIADLAMRKESETDITAFDITRFAARVQGSGIGDRLGRHN